MSNEAIPARREEQTIDAEWFNLLRSVMVGSIFPRNGGANVETLKGSLGTSIYRWLRAYIASGYWSIGDVKMHHSFNATKGPGQGWMLCDGRLINETNYNTEHGAGAWATYVGTSALDGKYLPNMTDKYPIGADATTQTGAAAITSVGNPNHSASIPSHGHKYIVGNKTNTPAQTYDSAGNIGNLSGSVTTGPNSVCIQEYQYTQPDYYTSKTTSSATIRPESITTQFYMRVI